MADALDSGSSEGFLHAGSSPVSRTASRTFKTFGFLHARSAWRVGRIKHLSRWPACAFSDDAN